VLLNIFKDVAFNSPQQKKAGKQEPFRMYLIDENDQSLTLDVAAVGCADRNGHSSSTLLPSLYIPYSFNLSLQSLKNILGNIFKFLNFTQCTGTLC
jgi:hypothetical protein